MKRTSLSSLVVRPPYPEALSDRQWRVAMLARIAVGLVAIVFDVGTWLGLRGARRIDPSVLRWFVAINVPLLALDVLLSIAIYRLARLRKPGWNAVTAAIEALTIAVWLHASGTLSSYFIPTGMLLIVIYRMYFGWGPGLAATIAMIAFHLGAAALELAGVLRPEALFAGPLSTVYTVPAYQHAAMISMLWMYVFAFVGANAITNRLREKDLALAEVRREVERVAADARHGRLTGTLLADRYALGELLGRGGMGEIYVARRIADDVQLAIKVLHGHLVDDETILERFRREAELAARLPAAHVARVHEVGSDPARSLHFIAMDYLRGEDLGAYFRRRGPLALGEVVALGRAIAVALDDAHAAGVVHRDLKPQNVFLVEGDEEDGGYDVRLLDFGIAHLHDGGSHTLTHGVALLGTPGYMSPEQASGRIGELGPASDRFALAAILYRALTGQPPFAANDLGALIHDIVHVDPLAPGAIVAELPADVDLVFALALAKLPADRPPSAAALVELLAQASAGALPAEARRRARGRALAGGLGEARTINATHTATDPTLLGPDTPEPRERG